MVQYTQARVDDSFAALSDATRRGVLEQLGRSDASITDLAEKFHMTARLVFEAFQARVGLARARTRAVATPHRL